MAGAYKIQLDGEPIGTVIKFAGEPPATRWVGYSVVRLPGDKENRKGFRTRADAVAWLEREYTSQPAEVVHTAKAARERLGLTQTQMGELLGYSGAHVRQMVYEIEQGQKPLMPCQRRLLDAYLSGYRPNDWPTG